MRARWRAWSIRAAVIAVMSTIGVLAVASPAAAAKAVIGDTNASFPLNGSGSVSVGTDIWVRFRIRMDGTAGAVGGEASYNVVSNLPSNLQCYEGCGAPRIDVAPLPGTEITSRFHVVGYLPSDTPATITVTAQGSDGGPDSVNFDFKVLKTPTEPQLTGTVVELLTGTPVKSASVVVKNADQTWDNVATDDGGNFIITGEIIQGDVEITVTADGYDDFVKVYTYNQWRGGVRITMVSNASATPTTSAPPITASIESQSGTTAAAAGPDEGLSTFSLTLIIVGGLLVVVGIGAIVLLFVRKGGTDGPAGPGGRGKPTKGGGPGGRPTSPGRGPLPPGPRRPGVPDRTAPMRPGSGPPRPGGPGDRTMIARSPLADNPTQHPGRGPARPGYGPPPAAPHQPPGYPPAPGPGGYGPPGPPTQAYPPPGPPQQGGYGQPGYGQQTYGGQPGYGTPPQAPDPRHTEPRPPRPPRTEGRRVDWMDDY
jgi:hypothetical protein